MWQGCLRDALSALGVRRLILAAALLPSLGLGCVTFDKLTAKTSQGSIHQVQTYWCKDPKQISMGDGRNIVGLAGRVYLFGAELTQSHPAQGAGKMVVQMQYLDQKNKPFNLQWEFPKQKLDQLLRKDFLGWGYTIPLPWVEYHPGVKMVTIQVVYVTEKGQPIYSQPSTFTLEQSGPTSTNRQVAAQDFRPSGPSGLAIGKKDN